MLQTDLPTDLQTKVTARFERFTDRTLGPTPLSAKIRSFEVVSPKPNNTVRGENP